MLPVCEMPSVATVAERRIALEKVLSSSALNKTPRLAALLNYLCLKSLDGEAEPVKEYHIAQDVFGRPASFDQATDAIVRVEMHRLRKKLKEFYAAEGKEEQLEIVIHAGRYTPEFVSKIPVPATNAPLTPVPEEPEAALVEDTSYPLVPRFPALSSRGIRIALICSCAAGLITLLYLVNRTAIVSARNVDKAAFSSAASRSDESIRILCGSTTGGYRDRQGEIWGEDRYFTKGTAGVSPDKPVYRTNTPTLFQHLREGDVTYEIPLKPGAYELRLMMADKFYSPGPAMDGGESYRVFDIYVNHQKVIGDFDVIADAGPQTADIRVFKDIHPAEDGFLHIEFTKNYGTPFVNAIEIVPGVPGRLRPIRIVTQESPYTDREGRVWSPDNYFLNGRMTSRNGNTAATADPELFSRERYGSFSYAIPVTPGRYTVTLHFSEAYFGPHDPGGGGVGSRLFNVHCNGLSLLRDFDVFQEAGGSHRALSSTFHDLRPNAQGKLLLSFEPVKNYAMVSAIEVLDEGP